MPQKGSTTHIPTKLHLFLICSFLVFLHTYIHGQTAAAKDNTLLCCFEGNREILIVNNDTKHNYLF